MRSLASQMLTVGCASPRCSAARVTLRELQPRTLVALKFRGRYDAERVRQATKQLLDSAREHEIEVRGEPAFAGYDAPSTLPLLRHNEVWVEVAEPEPAGTSL